MTLEQNYRSTAPILRAANVAARRRRTPYPRTLRATAPDGEPPELVWCDDEARQADAVADRVLAAREAGVELQRQAVLMRASHHSALLELELTRRRVPFVKYGGLRYLEAAHVKDFLALLRLVENPRDELSWFRVLQLLEGVGPVRARRVVDRLTRDDVPRGGLAAALLDVGERSRRRRREPAVDAARRARRARPATGRSRSASKACARALEPLLEARYADAAVRIADVDQLAAACVAAGDLGRFAAELAHRPAVVERRPGRPAASRRGVPRALDRALGEGPGVGRRARARALRRALPDRHGAHRAARGSRRSAVSSTSRSRARAASSTSTCRRASTTTRRGATTCTAYGTTSRFLTDELRATTTESHVHRPGTAPLAADAAAVGPIEVSVEELWR